MITVRFPNGQAVQYNKGWYVEPWNGMMLIKDKRDGELIAGVPTNCIIEWTAPCCVDNPLVSVQNEKLEALTKEIQSLKRKLSKMEKK